MNREIKFRLWDTNEKEFVEPKQIAVKGNGEVMADTGKEWIEDIDKDYFIVMQYTGLKDKNGKEIYERDIVECGYGKGEVIFKSGCFWVQWIDDKEAYMEWLHSRKGTYIRTDDELFEIIGNIYENPELLK